MKSGKLEEFNLGPVSCIEDGGMLQVEIKGFTVLLSRRGSDVSAVDGICPHRGAQLASGTLNGNTVVCPWHEWEFDVETGCGLTNPISKLKCYEVEVRGEDIILRLPTT